MEILTKLMNKNIETIDRLDILETYVNDLSNKKSRKLFISSFNTLNNPNRWKYIWQRDTITHIKFLLFLTLLKREMKKSNLHSGDIEDFIYTTEVLSNIRENKTAIFTLYLIVKVFKKRKLDLVSLSLKLDNIKASEILNYNSNSRFYNNYDEYISIIKGITKKL